MAEGQSRFSGDAKCPDFSAVPFGTRYLWVLALVGLCGWHAWMTLTLFGPDRPWQRLVDEQPIVSGRHPLHLYHGYLGAQALRERGTVCCYDPAFQAGYPKTPVFDSGSRPAEFFLTLAGGTYNPAAYKIGLAISCLAVPLLLFAGACAIGLGCGGSCLATALGLQVWWGTPCRELLEMGDLDVLFCSLAVLAQVGFLVQFHRLPGLTGWLGLFASAALGWYSQPVLFVLLFPLLLIYYFSVGTKHGMPWHLALLGALAGSIAVNYFWLFDWFAHWWIRSPLQPQIPLLRHRTFHTLWSAPLWGEGPDRFLAVLLIGMGAIGVCVLNETNQRPAARLLGLGAGGFLTLALAGIAWEPLGRMGTPHLLVPALWFAVVPATVTLVQGFRLLARLTGGFWRGAGVTATLLGATSLLFADNTRSLALGWTGTASLFIGLAPEDKSLVDAIQRYTSSDARILWEDQSGDDSACHWSALLPVLTDRAFLGGLDPETLIEHSYASLVDQKLAGRPLSSWSDADLDGFFCQYNVGWVICRSAAALARLRAYQPAHLLFAGGGDQPRYLFELPHHAFALKGQARVISADCRHIALADVVPEDGQVVLSMHYQAGLRASPSRIQVEKEPDPRDPIPFIRLRVPGPVARLTLTWQNR